MKTRRLLALLLLTLSLSCCDPVDYIVPETTYCWECTSVTTLTVTILGIEIGDMNTDETITEICDMTKNEIRLYERVGTMKISREDFTYESKISCTKK